MESECTIGASSSLSIDGEETGISIKSCPKLGRYLVSEKNFSPLSLIFEEWPIVIAPSGQMDLKESKVNEFYPVCISCFLSLTDESCENFSCDNCHWPLCCKNCVYLDEYHEKMECDLLKKQNISQTAKSLRLIYFIRCLYLSNNDKSKWDQLLNLSAFYTPQESVTKAKDPVTENKEQGIFEDLKNIYSEPISIELISQLNGIRNVNAFQINYSELDEKKHYGMVLYSKACIASHSCSPNTQWRIKPDKRRGFPIRLQANDFIKKGSLISIAYRNKCLTSGTLCRREEIFIRHGFHCWCDRCVDSTEFGTSFSALHCTQCMTGYILPQDSLDEKSDWICQECGGCENISFVREILDRITGQISKAKEPSKSKFSEICWKLDTIIRKYTDKILHPNHYLILWAEFLWLQYLEYHLFFYQSTSLKYEVFLLMTKRANHCKDVYSKFLSVNSRFYGYFEKMIGFAMYLYYYSTSTWENMSDEHKLKVMKETLQHFENSLIYDGWDCEDLKFIDEKLQQIKSTVAKILTRIESCNTL